MSGMFITSMLIATAVMPGSLASPQALSLEKNISVHVVAEACVDQEDADMILRPWQKHGTLSVSELKNQGRCAEVSVTGTPLYVAAITGPNFIIAFEVEKNFVQSPLVGMRNILYISTTVPLKH